MRREGVDAPQVKCDKCNRWAYLDETGYKTFREARAASDFVCTLCVSDTASTSKLEPMEAETITLRGLITHLQDQLLKVTAQLGLNATSSAAENDTMQDQMKCSHEPEISQAQELTSDIAHSESDSGE